MLLIVGPIDMTINMLYTAQADDKTDIKDCHHLVQLVGVTEDSGMKPDKKLRDGFK